MNNDDDLKKQLAGITKGPKETDIAINARMVVPFGGLTVQDREKQVGVVVPMPGQDFSGQCIWLVMSPNEAAQLVYGLQQVLFQVMGIDRELPPGSQIVVCETSAEKKAKGIVKISDEDDPYVKMAEKLKSKGMN